MFRINQAYDNASGAGIGFHMGLGLVEGARLAFVPIRVGRQNTQQAKRKIKVASINKRILPSGKPQWRVSFIDANGHRKRPGFSSWTQADVYRQEIEGQLRNGTYRVDADRVTVQEVCEAYLVYVEGRMKRNERMTKKTFVVIRGHIYNYILHTDMGVSNRKLSQLSAKAVGDFRDAVRDAGVSVSTSRGVDEVA